MGSTFIVHGIRHDRGILNEGTSATASLNFVAMALLGVPTVLYAVSRDRTKSGISRQATLMLSHAVAVLLIALYIAYLAVMLWTHDRNFDNEFSEPEDEETTDESAFESHGIYIGPYAAGFWLISSLVFVALCGSCLVSSLEGSTLPVSKAFVGFVLFPFLANIPDYTSACMVHGITA